MVDNNFDNDLINKSSTETLSQLNVSALLSFVI